MAVDIQARGMAGANAIAIKGLTSGVKSAVVSGTTIVFTMNDNSKQTMTFPAPADGVSIVDVDWTDNNEIICTMSNGTTITTSPLELNAEMVKYTKGAITTVKGALDKLLSQEITVQTLEYTNAEEPTVNNVKSALDVLFEEGGGVLEEEIKPNVIMGSVKDTYPVGTSLETILRDMLTEKIPPSVSLALNPSTTLYDEVSGSINSLTINAIVTKKTNPITKVEYYINNTLVHTNTNAESGGTLPYIYNTVIDNDAIIKVVVTDSEGLTATASKTITFIGNSYYGLVDAETGEPTEALVKTLDKTLKNTKKYVYSGITTDWAKICYAYPAELGKLTSIMDKVNNFNYTSSFQLTTKSIDGISYYVYTLIDPTGADNVELTFE